MNHAKHQVVRSVKQKTKTLNFCYPVRQISCCLTRDLKNAEEICQMDRCWRCALTRKAANTFPNIGTSTKSLQRKSLRK